MIRKVRTRELNVSRKDLRMVTKYLVRRLNNKKYASTTPLDAMNKALTHALTHPIPYPLRGAAHKTQIGPARRPEKTIKAVIMSLKSFKMLKINKVTRLYNELMTWNVRSGITRSGRGQGSRRDVRKSRLVIEYEQ